MLTESELLTGLKSEIHLADYADSEYCNCVSKELLLGALNFIEWKKAEIKELKRELGEAKDYEKRNDKY